jgi:hypothetical protein
MSLESVGVGGLEEVFLVGLMEGSFSQLLVLGFRAAVSFFLLRRGVLEAFAGALEMLRDC